MAEGEEEAWIKPTQDTLGKLISKPKMTEKYLKKPPFRFLHDIVMEVTRSTEFGQGLFSTEECDAAQLSDKAAKVEFLNKAISLVSFALNDKIDVSANKIVAGLEPEKTNAWLVKLHQAATTTADKGASAVQRVLSGETVASSKKPKKEKKESKEEPEAAAAPAAAPADDAAAAEDEKKKKDEARRKKREEEKAKKKAEEEAAKAAEGGGAAPPADGADDEEAKKKEEKKKKEEDKKRREERKQREREEKEAQEAAAAAEAQAQAQAQQAQAQAQAEAQAAQEAQMQAAALEEQRLAAEAQAAAAAQQEQGRIAASPPLDQFPEGVVPSAPGSAGGQQPLPGPPIAGSPEDIAARAAAEGMLGDDANRRPDRPRTAGRRPPKVTSKVKETAEAAEAAPVAAPIIFGEGAKDDDDDGFEETPQQLTGFGSTLNSNGGDESGVHGKFVSNLLAEKKKEQEAAKAEEENTREELDEAQKGIKMGKLKRKGTNKDSHIAEVDTVKLGELIQTLCQAANPLGKSIDLVHQDIANMGKELDHWKLEYRQASDSYQRQVIQTEEMLQPLYQKIAELDDQIAEQKSKIRNSRSRISQNDEKIQTLLTSVVSTNRAMYA